MASASSYGAISQNENYDVEASSQHAEAPRPSSWTSRKVVSGAALVVALVGVSVLVSTNSFGSSSSSKVMNLKKSKDDYAWTGFIPEGGENTPPPSPTVHKIDYTETLHPTYKVR
jgi:hypothetical protein